MMIVLRSRTCYGLAVVVVLLFAATLSIAGDDGQQDTQRGWLLYSLYCTGCHGVEGRGDGPVATRLSPAPTDLTRIAERNGGTFSATEVYDKIYGLDQLPGHRKTDMPLWGFEFLQVDLDANQQREVRERITQLVRYLATIQRKD